LNESHPSTLPNKINVKWRIHHINRSEGAGVTFLSAHTRVNIELPRFFNKKKDYNIFPTMILIDASLRVENENKNCGHHKIIKLFAPAVSCLKNPLQ